MDPLKRPARPKPQTPADIEKLNAIIEALRELMDAFRTVGPTLALLRDEVASLPAPQVNVAASDPVVLPAPEVVMEWDTLLDGLAELSRLPELLSVTVNNDVLPVEVRNRIGLDEETIKALKDATKATGEVGRVLSAGGSYGPVVAKLEELDANLELILTAVGGSTAGKATLLDYDVRLDGNPVYVGTADQGTATASPLWRVQRLSYDVSARLVDKQEIVDAIWDDRATLGWAAY